MRSELLIAWFRENRQRLPAEPFPLGLGRYITGPTKFYASLDADIAAGPTATICGQQIPRQRWQPLLEDLAALRRYVASVNTRPQTGSVTPEHSPVARVSNERQPAITSD